MTFFCFVRVAVELKNDVTISRAVINYKEP